MIRLRLVCSLQPADNLFARLALLRVLGVYLQTVKGSLHHIIEEQSLGRVVLYLFLEVTDAALNLALAAVNLT